MLQNPRKTLGFKNNMIYIISPARGGGVGVNHVYPMALYVKISPIK